MRKQEWLSSRVFTLCAIVVIVAIAAIFLFVGLNAYQTFTVDHINPFAFFFGTHWSPDDGTVGSLILITGSITVTLLAVLISTPLSVGLALFVTEIAPPWARSIMQPVLELLTGIPSVIFGFLGLQLIVPLIRDIYNGITGNFYSVGFNIIAAAVVLTVMVLPTITTISIDALGALPTGLREASLALGATRWQTIARTLVPAASTGILTGVILGMGRAIGETLAVSFVIGSNSGSFPVRITNTYPYVTFPPTSTITVQLLFDFKEAAAGSLNYHAIWTLAFILLLIAFLLVVASRWVTSHSVYNTSQRENTGKGKIRSMMQSMRELVTGAIARSATR